MSPQGATFIWAFLLFGGLTVMFGLTQWGWLSDVDSSATGFIAVGVHNGIGVIAMGGWNAIGLVAIGGANSIGAVTIGGMNSVGFIAIGGFNSVGFITIGGIHAVGFRATSIFQWGPRLVRGGATGTYDATAANPGSAD